MHSRKFENIPGDSISKDCIQIFEDLKLNFNIKFYKLNSSENASVVRHLGQVSFVKAPFVFSKTLTTVLYQIAIFCDKGGFNNLYLFSEIKKIQYTCV